VFLFWEHEIDTVMCGMAVWSLHPVKHPDPQSSLRFGESSLVPGRNTLEYRIKVMLPL